jgi:hypothetical protein
VDLKSRLIQAPPRDLSGPLASDRFTYQQTWALCHLLELHESGNDYVVIFDHHEDVSTLDSEDQPTILIGYQIKTKDPGRYTVQALLKREKGAGNPPSLLPSILGKLFDLKVRFPTEVRLLAIVSNTSVSVRLKSDGKVHYDQELTKFSELDIATQDAIVLALQKELGLPEKPVVDGLLEFRKADLPIKGHDTHGTGKLAEFLQRLFPKKEFRVMPLFRALLSEVVSKNNNLDPNHNYDDFLKHKALSRRRFTEVLEQAGVSHRKVDLLEVSQRLNSEEAPLPIVSGIRREWDSVLLDRLAKRDIPHLRLWESVRAAVNNNLREQRLLDLIAKATAEVIPQLKREWAFSENYINTCIVIEVYERQ